MSDAFDPARFVQENEWTFASTMKSIPHWYVVRGKNGCDADDWDAMWAYIREHGFWARWYSGINIYLDVGEHRYWMIYPVINREKLDGSSKTVPLSPEEAEAARRLTKDVPLEKWAWSSDLYRYPVPQGEQSRLFEGDR